MSAELKPCPKCGAEPETWPALLKPFVVIMCSKRETKWDERRQKNYETMNCSMTSGKTLEEAAAKWNEL